MLVAPEEAICPCQCHDANAKRLCGECCAPEFLARELRESEHDCGNPDCPHRWREHCWRCPACGYCWCEMACSCESYGHGGSEEGPCWDWYNKKEPG